MSQYFGQQGSTGDGRPVPGYGNTPGGSQYSSRATISPTDMFGMPGVGGGGGAGGGNFGGSVGGGSSSNNPMGITLPSFGSLQAGGGIRFNAETGQWEQTAADQTGMFNALTNFLSNWTNSQAQLAGTGLQTASNEAIAQLQKELGMYTTDAEVGGRSEVAGIQAGSNNYASDNQLAGQKYSADQQLAGILGVANLEDARKKAYFDQFSQMAAGFGGGAGGGDFSVPYLDPTAALNRGQEAAAMQRAAADNSARFAGGSPMAGAYSQRNALNEGMTNARNAAEIPQQYNEQNFQNALAAYAARANAANQRTGGLASIISAIS